MRLPLGTLLLSLTLLPACGKDPGDSTDTNQTGTGTTTATTGTSATTTATSAATTGASEATTVTSTVTGTDTGEPATGTTSIETTAGTTTTGTTTTGTTTTGTATDSTTGDTGDTGVVPGGECVEDSDCTLHNDCCDCLAVPAPDELAICKKGCDQKQCELLEISAATCRFGVCVTEKVPCDPMKVACDSLPPDCPKGQVASVKDGCWSGHCVPAISCDVVPSCDLCPDGFMCVFKEAQIPMPPTCEPIPAQCDGKIDCGCAGQQVCIDGFDACNKVGDDELHCACPAC
jgi:hypothetical protein